MKIGPITGTVTELKGQINKTLGISWQRLFYRKAQGGADVELDFQDEGGGPWPITGSSGATL